MQIDEDGTFSLGSDHNRLRVDFSSSTWKWPQKEQYKTVELVLPVSAIEIVAKEFEASTRRASATNYEEFIRELKHLIKVHSIQRRSRGGFRRNSWWDAEAKAARDARRQANQAHRRAVKGGNSVEVELAWNEFLTLKHKLQVLIQYKMTEADQRKIKELKDSGKAAAEKFWRYVRSMDSRDPVPTVLEDDTGKDVVNLAEYLSEYLTLMFESRDPVATPRKPGDLTESRPPGSEERSVEPKWEVTTMALDRAITHIKTNTARGKDGIPVAILKCMGDQSRRQLTCIFTNIISGSSIPDDWVNSRIVLLPKRGGNKRRLQDYRPLTVTSVIYRVFAHVIKEWMCAWAEGNGKLTELQNGFRKDRRLEDNLFVLDSQKRRQGLHMLLPGCR